MRSSLESPPSISFEKEDQKEIPFNLNRFSSIITNHVEGVNTVSIMNSGKSRNKKKNLLSIPSSNCFSQILSHNRDPNVFVNFFLFTQLLLYDLPFIEKLIPVNRKGSSP
jgi:hypothetical protein